jgi:signal transduction histidine kinase
MRYLYQLLLAFFGVAAIILITVGLVFTQFTRKTIMNNNYKDLVEYALSIRNTSQTLSQSDPLLTDEQAFQQAISLTEGVLNEQKVNFMFVTKDKTVTYPRNFANTKQKFITSKQWNQLKKGNQQKMTSSNNYRGEKQTTSVAMIPFTMNNAFYGVLVVSQPATNIDDSVHDIVGDLLKGFLISAIIAMGASFIFAYFQVKKIKRLSQASKEISAGNFDIEIMTKGRDEFDDLANDFNHMAGSLKQSQIEIEDQENRRRQFMADAAHEMRTPLTTINGLLEGMQYNAIPENQKEKALNLMKNETERLIRLVNENLDYEKIRTNQISMVIKKFSATQTMENLLEQLQKQAEAANDQLVLTTTDEIEVYADYDRFMQIMVNIIKNAIQFTSDGTISVAIEKGYLETIVKISDTGIGMSEEQVANIWERYYKVDPSRKNTKYGESGLGLPIVQQLVRLHKGKIDVESELGKGTTFIITFPDVEIKESEATE